MGFRKHFFKFYYIFEKLIVPGLKKSKIIYEEKIEASILKGSMWLDLGCGHRILHKTKYSDEYRMVNKAKCSVGLDCHLLTLQKHRTLKNRVCGDISNLPYKQSTFDIVTANMVFEHLNDPYKQMKEIYRILKPGGKLLFHTPNTIGYTTILARFVPEILKAKIVFFLQGRGEDDLFKTYFKINTVKKILKIANDLKFKIGSIKTTCNGAQLVMIPPLAILEFFWIRLLMTRYFVKFRNSIIAELIKIS